MITCICGYSDRGQKQSCVIGYVRCVQKERGLMLNAGKTKVMVFNKNEKEKAEKWIWGVEKLEEVKTFKYLGFTFNRKGDVKDHIKALSTKGRMAANKVWSIEERICKDDFIRKGNLFAYLVRSVMEYGVEIWGWSERKELEKIMLDYVRWVFRLDFTPRYIITRELGLDRLRIRWGIRARKYEEKIRGMEDTR